MAKMTLTLDQHTLDRLQALVLLRREGGGNEAWDLTTALHQALELGLEQLLREALMTPTPVGAVTLGSGGWPKLDLRHPKM